MKPDLPALTGLRGVAALWVLAYHVFLITAAARTDAQAWQALVSRGGYFGVDLFFVLSGFVLALNYRAADVGASVRAYSGFLWKRLARIYPVHLATLALFGTVAAVQMAVGAAPQRAPTVQGLLEALVLVQGWEWPLFANPSWNPPSWSLSAEWAAYLAFPGVALVASQLHSRALALALVLLAYAILRWQIDQAGIFGAMPYGMWRIATEFSAGVLLHRVWQLGSAARGVRWDRVALVALPVLVVGASAWETVVGRHRAFEVFPIVCAVVVYSCAAGRGSVTAWLSGPVMQYLGRISFALYMAHGAFLHAADHVLVLRDLAGSPLAARRSPLAAGAAAALVVALSLAAAHLLYTYVEEPARRRMLAAAATSRAPATPHAPPGAEVVGSRP